MSDVTKDFLSSDTSLLGDGSCTEGATSFSKSPGMVSQRFTVTIKDLRCEAYRGFAPVEDGGFIIVKPLGEDGLLCIMVDPAGRGPRSVEIGERLKAVVDSLLDADFLRFAGLKPAAVLERLDEVLDDSMSEL